jgi:hypothetical protein
MNTQQQRPDQTVIYEQMAFIALHANPHRTSRHIRARAHRHERRSQRIKLAKKFYGKVEN